MALTADEKTYIRMMSGDDCEPYVVSTAEMTILESVLGTTGNCAYILAVLQARLARATRISGLDNTGGQVPNPSTQGIRDSIRMWTERCPDALPAMEASTLALGIDEEWDDA